MTAHPIDRELWRETAASVRDDPYGITMSGGELLAILDALEAAEHRATRAEAQAEARRVNILYWQERAGAAQSSARTLAREFEETQDRAHEAEARIQAVRGVLEDYDHYPTVSTEDISRALDGDG